MRDPFGLHLEIFDASKALHATDYGVAIFRHDQHAHPCRNASGIIPIELRVGDLHFWRREAFDVVVNFLHVRRIKCELGALLEQERSRFFHIFLGQRNCRGRELHLRIPILELALHLLDLLAHASQLFFNLKQIGDFARLRFQHVDQALLHHACVLEPCIGVEIRFRNVFRAERLILQFAKSANFLQKAIKIFRQNLDHDLAAQLSICLFLGTCCRHVAALFVRKRGDLLYRVVKADDLQFDFRIADEFAVGQRRWSRFGRIGCCFLGSWNI